MLAAQEEIRVSNDTHDSNVFTAFEVTYGYTIPVLTGPVSTINDELVQV